MPAKFELEEVKKQPVAYEDLQAAVVAISEGFKKIEASRLGREAQVILIQEAANMPKSMRPTIARILEVAPRLEEIYLKPKTKKKAKK